MHPTANVILLWLALMNVAIFVAGMVLYGVFIALPHRRWDRRLEAVLSWLASTVLGSGFVLAVAVIVATWK